MMPENDEEFQVGWLSNPRPDDRKFPTQEEAEVYAIGEATDYASPLGIWRKADRELFSIAYHRQLFS